MEFRQLEAFVAIAKLGSFRAASMRLNATQPAISARIAALEGEFGVDLFNRGSRPTRLTPAGFRLLDQAEKMLDLATEMRRAGSGQVGQRVRRVRIGIPSALVQRWASSLIGEVYREFPGIQVELHIDRSIILKQLLLVGEIDFILAIGPIAEPELVASPVARYGYQWVIGKRLSSRLTVNSLSDIFSVPVLTYGKSSAVYGQLFDFLKAQGLADFQLSGSNSTDAILRLVADGMAVGFVMSIAITDSPNAFSFEILDLPTSSIPDVEYFACRRRDDTDSAAQFLFDHATTVLTP